MSFYCLLLGACTEERAPARGDGPDAPQSVESAGDNGEPAVPPPLRGDYDVLFNPAVLQEIRLGMSAAAIDALNADGATFVPAVFEHDGNALDVGVRLKGSSTYQDFGGKPALRIKFDEVVPKQEYATLRRLALNNLTGDPAQGREVVAYLAWGAGGMPVPRASLARVYVNDEYYGLYAAIEGMDEAWVARRFADPGGDLWAANDHADLTVEGVANFQLNCGSGEGPVTPTEAAEALAPWSTDFATQASTVVDLDQFLDFWAWSIATGGQDGYPSHLNDYFLYADPAREGRLVFAPWGQDESWSDLWAFTMSGGVMAWKCEGDPACVDRLHERIDAALAVVERIDLVVTAEAVFELSRGAVQEDVRSPYTPAEVEAARVHLVDRIATWPDTVRASVGLWIPPAARTE